MAMSFIDLTDLSSDDDYDKDLGSARQKRHKNRTDKKRVRKKKRYIPTDDEETESDMDYDETESDTDYEEEARREADDLAVSEAKIRDRRTKKRLAYLNTKIEDNDRAAMYTMLTTGSGEGAEVYAGDYRLQTTWLRHLEKEFQGLFCFLDSPLGSTQPVQYLQTNQPALAARFAHRKVGSVDPHDHPEVPAITLARSDEKCQFFGPVYFHEVNGERYASAVAEAPAGGYSELTEVKLCDHQLEAYIAPPLLARNRGLHIQPEHLLGLIVACEKKSALFSGTELYIHITGTNAHANALIYDHIQKSLTRYEPQGRHSTSYDFEHMDEELQKFVEDNHVVFPGGYISPRTYAPEMGPQTLELLCDQQTDPTGNAKGYCSAFSMMFLHTRLIFPRKTWAELAKFVVSDHPEILSIGVRSYMAAVYQHVVQARKVHDAAYAKQQKKVEAKRKKKANKKKKQEDNKKKKQEAKNK